MIDTKELRKMAQAATPGPWRIGAMESGRVAIDGVNGSEVTGFIDPEDGHLILAAANPAVISELLDRLEAAESDAAHQKALADSALRVAEGWEEKCNSLRAKIEQMERQEPVAWTTKLALEYGASRLGFQVSGVNMWGENGVPLYALPGAQNIPEKMCYDSRWEISIDYVDGWNAAVDMMRGKSPSWHCPDCCIAFPFGAPKSCPNDDARCNSLLAAAPEAKP